MMQPIVEKLGPMSLRDASAPSLEDDIQGVLRALVQLAAAASENNARLAGILNSTAALLEQTLIVRGLLPAPRKGVRVDRSIYRIGGFRPVRLDRAKAGRGS